MGLLPPKCPDTFPSCYFQNSCCPLALPECLITWSKRCKPVAAPACPLSHQRGHQAGHPLAPGDRTQTAAVPCEVGPSQHLHNLFTAGAHPLTVVKLWCLSSNATFLKPPKQAAYEIWTHTTTNIGLTCPFLKRQRNQLSFYFQGAIAAGTKENRGGNTFLKPFPKHLHLHAGWWTMSTH